jgi:hypothetical protein
LIVISYEEDHQLQIIEAAEETKIQEAMDIMKELENALVNDPDSLKDTGYLKQLKGKVSLSHIGVLIQYDGQFMYNSLPVSAEKLTPFLSKFQQQAVSTRWVSAITKDYFLKCRAFSFSDGTAGRLYLFMDRTGSWDTPSPNHVGYVKWVFLIFIICIFLTNSFLTY